MLPRQVAGYTPLLIRHAARQVAGYPPMHGYLGVRGQAALAAPPSPFNSPRRPHPPAGGAQRGLHRGDTHDTGHAHHPNPNPKPNPDPNPIPNPVPNPNPDPNPKPNA